MRQGWEPPLPPLPEGVPEGLRAVFKRARRAMVALRAASAAGEPLDELDELDELVAAGDDPVSSRREALTGGSPGNAAAGTGGADAAGGGGVAAAGGEAGAAGGSGGGGGGGDARSLSARLAAARSKVARLAGSLADRSRRERRERQAELEEMLAERQAHLGSALRPAAAALDALQSQERALEGKLMAGDMARPALPTVPHPLARLPPELVLRILRTAAYPLSAWVAAEDLGLGGGGGQQAGGGVAAAGAAADI